MRALALSHRPARPDAPQLSGTVRQRLQNLLSSALAAVLGVLPHVLHHAGPLAGAALLAGTTGSLLFGAIGLIAAIPFLTRVHRRCGNWRIPAALLATFAAVFALSTFVIGPAITGSGGQAAKTPPASTAPATPGGGHESHH